MIGSAGMKRRSFKLQEFVAHGSDVSCLQIGRKSGQVLVTGGEDKMVNMWRLGKHTNIMSLSGHTSAVESVTFDPHEEVVAAGSQGGSVKLFDLAEAKVARTLTGHMSSVRAVDFHPFGDFLASGSLDTNLKVWDIRRKQCIQTYKGHTKELTCVQFSPDGRWVISGGMDGIVKLWDLTAGKLLHNFTAHTGPITALDFNPNEFLLASGSADRTVKFWDLETFELVSSTAPDTRSVRALAFSANGRHLTSATQDSMKVWSWEPEVACHDTVDMGGANGWQRVSDIFNSNDEQLVACSFRRSFVSAYVIELTRVHPFSQNCVAEQTGQQSGIDAVTSQPQTQPQAHHAPIAAEDKEQHAALQLSDSKQDEGEHIRYDSTAASKHSSGDHDRDVLQQSSTVSLVSEERADAKSAGSCGDARLAVAKDSDAKVPDTVVADNKHDLSDSLRHCSVATSMGDSFVDRQAARLTDDSKALQPCDEALHSAQAPQPQRREEAKHARPGAGPGHERVPTNHRAPVGLNFQDFMQPAAQPVTGRIVDALVLGSADFRAIMRARLVELSELRAFWVAGNLRSALSYLAELEDPTHTAAAFLGSVSLGSTGMDLEGCCTLLPVVSRLVCSKFDSYVLVGVRAASTLLGLYSEVITNTRVTAQQSSGLVDVHMEGRQRRCNRCYDEFHEMSKQVVRVDTDTHEGELVTQAKQLSKELFDFLKAS